MVNKSVEVYAGTVDYQTFGAVGAPETIVLLHASATGAWSLAPLADILSDRYRVLVPNLDGYGMSKLDCARCPATFRHVQTVERFLKALGIERFHLFGHSMGGLIALRIARRDRFDLRSLTLIEPMAFGVLDPVSDKDAIDYDRKQPPFSGGSQRRYRAPKKKNSRGPDIWRPSPTQQMWGMRSAVSWSVPPSKRVGRATRARLGRLYRSRQPSCTVRQWPPIHPGG